MQGTVIEDTLVLDDIKTSGADLLSGGEDSDSEVDGNATTYNTPFWAPQTSSSKILTNDIARAITESTEANLFPEHDRNRVVIMGGDATAALEMLTNLEPLMVSRTLGLHATCSSNKSRIFLPSNREKARIVPVRTC